MIKNIALNKKSYLKYFKILISVSTKVTGKNICL
jgi:hypothetical protein